MCDGGFCEKCGTANEIYCPHCQPLAAEPAPGELHRDMVTAVDNLLRRVEAAIGASPPTQRSELANGLLEDIVIVRRNLIAEPVREPDGWVSPDYREHFKRFGVASVFPGHNESMGDLPVYIATPPAAPAQDAWMWRERLNNGPWSEWRYCGPQKPSEYPVGSGARLEREIFPLYRVLPAQDAAFLRELEARKNAAYHERNQVVAALSALFPAGVARTAIEGWSEDWHGCVYIDLPTGQVSWHFHDSEAHLFAHLPAYKGEWDGHDTPEKYRRLAALRAPKPEVE